VAKEYAAVNIDKRLDVMAWHLSSSDSVPEIQFFQDIATVVNACKAGHH